MDIKSKFIKLNDLDIEYFDEGEGEDFLLLHGGGGSFRSYLNFIDELSNKYHVWAPSLPGAGKSSKLPLSWRFDKYADVIKGFIDYHNINPIIAGHSFGGAVAIKSKSMYPDNFKALILISSAGVKHKKPMKIIFKVAKWMAFELKKKDKRKNDKIFIQETELNLKKHKIDLLRIGRLFCKLDLTKDLKSIKDRIIVLWGVNDDTLEYSDFIKICNAVVDEDAVLVEGDHGFVTDDYKNVAKIINAKLNEK